MAERGPPPNKGTSKGFQVTVPQPVYDYLGYLAQRSVFGVSETEVASFILRQRVEELLKSGFHKIDIPKADAPKGDAD